MDDSNSARLGLWDTVSIVIGIVVGASIFKVPKFVFENVEHAWQGVSIWIVGGGLSLIGALCYAELATTYPRSGGGYVYLTRAYGRIVGFLFGWGQLVAILSGSISALAYVFGDYAVRLFGLGPENSLLFAIGAVLFVTLVNYRGIIIGKAAQNILTLTKVFGLCMVLVWGMFSYSDRAPAEPVISDAKANWGIAMVLVLYAYGGWNDAAFVTAEVRNPRRNMPLALVLGTVLVAAVYALVNLAYVRALGFEGVRQSLTPAADVIAIAAGSAGTACVSVLVLISTLGAVNGMCLAGSRIYAELGTDYPLLKFLAWRHPNTGAPTGSLIAQAFVAVLLILAVGTQRGRDVIDAMLAYGGMATVPWVKFHGGFDTLVAGTAPVFWLFFLLTGVGLFVLRIKDTGIDRPFSVPWFPIIPLMFCFTSLYMLYASVRYSGMLSLVGLIPLLVGCFVFFISDYFRAGRRGP